MSGQVFYVVLMFERRYSLVVVVNLVGLVIATTSMLVPRARYIGAPMAALISFGALVSMVAVISNRLEPIQFETVRLALVFGTGTAVIVLASLIPGVTVIGVVLKVAVASARISGWYVWILSADERDAIRRRLHGLALSIA